MSPETVSDKLAAGPATVRLPGFKELPPIPSQAHPDPPQGQGPDQLPASPGPDLDETSGPGTTSIPGSTDRPAVVATPAPFRARVKAFTKLAEGGFSAIAGLLNRAVSTGPDDETFLPDDDDMATVPPPIARLAARRVELPLDEEGLTDAQDAIAAAIALGAWALKGLVEYVSTRRAIRRTLQGTAIHVDGDGAAERRPQ